MSQYKPMLIRFDEENYLTQTRLAQKKLNLLRDAVVWMENKNIIVKSNDAKSIHNSFVGYFEEAVYQKNKDQINSLVAKEKLLDLLDVNSKPLADIQEEYSKIDLEPKFDPYESNTPECESNRVIGVSFPVNRRAYEVYTNSAEQNAKLRDYRGFINALEKLSNHCHIYPHQIQIGTSGLVRYDIRNAEYFPNL